MTAMIVALGLTAAAAPATSETPPFVLTATQQSDQAEVDRASELISQKKPAEAIAALDTLMAAQAQEYKGAKGQVYCARSAPEKLLYKGLATKSTTVTIVPQSYCYPVFLKGFALIDLDRADEAKAWLDRALATAPSNSQFLGELAEWYKDRRQFDTAWTYFKRAETAARVSPSDRQIFDRSRALRGQGYILIERRQWDEAEALYRTCLQLDPNDERAKKQLQYIADHRQGS